MKGFFLRAWRGEEPLWRVFWVYGVVVGIVITIVDSVLSSFIHGIAYAPFFIFMLAYTVWNIVATWRCAFNAKRRLWGYIARVIMATSSIVVLLSLLLMIFGAGAIVGGVAGTLFGGGVVAGTAIDDSMKPALLAAQSCKTEIEAYVNQGGSDVDSFSKECMKKHLGNADVAPNPAATPPLPPPSPEVLLSPQEKYKQFCEKTMADHAEKNGAVARQYIAQNQAYLEQCIHYYLQQDAAHSSSP